MQEWNILLSIQNYFDCAIKESIHMFFEGTSISLGFYDNAALFSFTQLLIASLFHFIHRIFNFLFLNHV